MRCSSNRIAIQLVTVCSLIDSTLREMLGQSGKSKTLDLARLLLDEKAFDPKIEIQVFRATGSCSVLQPWVWLDVDDIKKAKVPDWLAAYGYIKHDRYRHFDQGNLGNLMNAQAALYFLELVYAKKIGDFWHEKLGYQENGSTMDVPNDISKAFSADGYVTRDHVFAFQAYAISDEETDRF